MLVALPSLFATPLREELSRTGYVEICDLEHGSITFNALYGSFDELIEFLQTHPVWAQKLTSAKERFIRSKERNYYSTDFLGLYDESKKAGRSQIYFYYSIHFHEFMDSRYPEFDKIPEIGRFFEACQKVQQSYGNLFERTAAELGIETIFSSEYGHPPILLKVIKYLSPHFSTRPHYDGTAFTLFLDSTDSEALLLSPYKSSFTSDDFSSPHRVFSRQDNQNSILLIPGAFLTEFSIYPTPHIVIKSGKTRYATVAFAMRPHFTPQKNPFSPLPTFGH